MSEQPDQPVNTGNGVLLNGRYVVFPDKRLPHMDSPRAEAVEARDQRAPSRSMFALICKPTLLPRIDVIPQLSRRTKAPIIAPIDAGVMDWPQTGGRRFAIVFELEIGERVLASPDARITPMSEDHVVRLVIQPLIPAFVELSGRYVNHRAIRADNLFYSDASKKATVLGECVSEPPGYSQSVVYEPIEAAMAMPSGRGSGTVADDLYALGALLMVLLNGGNPVPDKTDDEIIRAKIELGSYAALLGTARVSLTLMEPLRGLLCDNPKERWTSQDLELWMGGRQLSPKQPMLPIPAARPISLDGENYLTKPAFAHAAGNHWSEAAGLVSSGELENWVRRGHSDDEGADSLLSVITSTSGREDALLSRALMVLGPELPLRFKNFSARLDGINQAFAIDYHNQEKRDTFVEMMNAKLGQSYMQAQPTARPNQASLIKTFDMFSYFTERQQLGVGVERALYESNHGWPCQSPLMLDNYILDIEDLLDALEKLAQRGTMDREPIDPHIVAFCGARLESLSDGILQKLNNHEDLGEFRMGVLQLLAKAQRSKAAKRKFPALSRLMASLMQPIVESYHNRVYRRQLAQKIEEASEHGDLVELLFLVDSYEAQQQDDQGFMQAQNEYANHARSIAWLQNGGLTSDAYIEAKSQAAATVLSATLSGLAIIALAVIYVT